jgi:hypothetical protein
MNKELIATALESFNQRDADRVEHYNTYSTWGSLDAQLAFTDERLNDVMALLSIVTKEILND